MHPHFISDKVPPPIRRPNAEALRQLTAHLEEGARRRSTALRTCHRPRIRPERAAYSGNSSAYVPQFSARLLNDPNLSDGARRCAVKLLELVYRRNRTGRSYQGTVLYLAKCLQRSERSIQNYLAQLRAGGYIRHEVITSARARMCVGVFITLLEPLFPKHHAREWPVQTMKSGVKKDSQNYRPESKYRRSGKREEVEHWALRCMDGVFRSLMKTIPPAYGSLA